MKEPAASTARRAARNKPSAKPLPVVRVAIVGGGCAGLATAWQLSQPPGGPDDPRRERYEITVYESTWRLGGKGASVRDAHGRILEHGLHVWMGFYENAFRMMRECYAEVQRQGWGPHAAVKLAQGRFDDAFTPEPHIGVASRRWSGDEQVWSGFLPPMPGQPGEPIDAASNPFTWWGYLARALALVKALMQSTLAAAEPDVDGSGRSALDEGIELDFSFNPLDAPDVLLERMARALRVGLLTSAAGLLQGVALLETWLREHNPSPQSAGVLLKFVEALARQSRRQLRDVVRVDEELRRKTEIVDLVMTILVGLVRDRVFFSEQGLDAIDHIDYRDWLLQHGATRESVASPLITGIYDLVFAYREGRHAQPALSAGQALRGAMRMFFCFRGAMFWRMSAGMGDVVFAPLYRTLAARGVKFRFLHRLQRVHFGGGDGSGDSAGRVTRLEFVPGCGATALPQGDTTPLDAFGGWPEHAATAFGPAFDGQGAQALALDDGRDFDAVVLAMGIDDFVRACGEQPDRNQPPTVAPFKDHAAWDTMRQHVATVGTRAAQAWLADDIEALGWQRGPVVVAGLADGGARGGSSGRKAQRLFETWADMTQTLAAERAHRRAAAAGQAGDRVRSVAYFCGVIPDDRKALRSGTAPDAQASRQRALDDLKSLLQTGMAPFWPAAFTHDSTPLDLLVSADGQRTGPACLDEQHVSVNDVGSERYTQSLPGGAACRISPLEPWFENMTIAGDWTHCGFNAGCVEAAVMSGMLASHAISRFPALHAVVAYDHP